jgi:Flp pilus assembly protein TadB
MTTDMILRVGLSSWLTLVAVFLGSVQFISFWDRLLQKSFRDPIERYLRLRLNEPLLREALRAWSIALIGGTLALLLLAHAYPLAVTWAVLLSIAPPHVIMHFVRQREQLLESQLIGSSTALSNSLKAGLTVPQALQAVSLEAPHPIRVELAQVATQFDHGRPLGEALSDARQRLKLESFTLFCLALEVAVERGGRVNVAMDRLGTSLQEWFRLRRKLDSDTSAGRYAVLIMGLCPVGFVLLFLMVGMHSILALFTNLVGQCVLAVIVVLIWSGVRWACRIMNIRLN